MCMVCVDCMCFVCIVWGVWSMCVYECGGHVYGMGDVRIVYECV